MRHLIRPAVTLAILAVVAWISTWDGLSHQSSEGVIVVCAIVFLLRCWEAVRAIRQDRARRAAAHP